MKVLETKRKGCLTFRRIEKENGRRLKTVEIPWSFWLSVRKTVNMRVVGFEKAEASRDRIAVIKKMLADGEKSEYIAAVVRVTGGRVRQIKCQRTTQSPVRGQSSSEDETD